MAQKYLNTSQAAEKLGVSEDAVAKMRENRELHGYRDGANWKFKVEDIEKLASKPAATDEPAAPEDDTGDVLLSEVELGQSDAGASGTVIGMGAPGGASAGSDLHKAGGKPAAAQSEDVDSKVSQFEDLDLTLDEDLTLEDSAIGTGDDAKGSQSGVDLDDDDMVLGGSGSGSDITLGGDSGISLVDPADSGLSLEEPLDLGSGEESLELGEDDMVVLDDESQPEAGMGSRTDDDFLLTPLEDESDEDSESGSQVIALDTEGDESATMVASTSNASMAAMLDEDLSAGGGMGIEDAGMGAPLGAQPGDLAAGAPLMQPAAALPEAPWSVWSVVALVLCVLVLVFCGMFTYDLMRNMWAWEGAYEVNSSVMETILGWFEG